MNKSPLIGKTLVELQYIVTELGLPSFTAKQIAEWLYKKHVVTIDEMTNISLKNRTLLSERYETGRLQPVQVQESMDGTKKYLFKTSDGHFIETVFIPEDDRATLCVSSQVGCKMDCLFCMTGKQGFNGQLTVAEILNQLLSVAEAEQLTNVVFMGMGEPFDNTKSLFPVIEILTSDYGFAWSPKRITVSTIGLLSGIKTFLEHTNCHLAVSLHSPFSVQRQELMPIEKAFPLQKLIDELRKHDFSHQRRLSFEYIMFDGLNDTVRHAVELVKLLRGLPCRVNLIRFHTILNVDLKSSNEEKMVVFRDYLSNNGIICTIRRSRGEDIAAACGMLSTAESEKENITLF